MLHNEIEENIAKFTSAVLASLAEIMELNSACKAILCEYLNNPKSIDECAEVKIQAVIDYMYEQVNIGNWKEVKLFLRKTITIATFLRLLSHAKLAQSVNDDFIKESFKIIDFGILFGCPLDEEPSLLQKCASIFNNLIEEEDTSKKVNMQNNLEEVNFDLSHLNTQPIEIVDCPSMEHFYRNYILREQPIILSNGINHWPALNKWKDPEYFKKLAGPRTVPVELGKVYTDSDWTQKLMTIGEFIDNYIYQSNGPTGYLAQYQLFDQIPELKKDIVVPEYCCFSETDEPVDIMAWFGPKGTVSALHHDPKKNLLTQVVGTKQLFLFSPNDTPYLYPHSHELLNNTAQVDPREPDLEKFPNYKEATAYHCILSPGQMLYIPPKWWHFVESLSISFSVSFWWD
ncbi:bifunctional peptidase and arginyl-hydroxylase JMJD5 isoform X1 [Amyelois transitella]|uniref:bifunctional peptidase and arginyl-hydroxylase JMJD5 isoform X1 n=1 Tax=Amyelois transitella TaxID=680683 RepID=UPI00298FA8EA|nr:bifunctional peptidase and arginyl-hydroxylase JMJD5 isoform X1 [Amyelois transitella]